MAEPAPEVQHPIAENVQIQDQVPAAEQQLAGPVNPEAAAAPANVVNPQQQELEKLKDELKTLRESVESVTKPSVESMMNRITSYLARPLSEFNNYEILEMLETLQNTASDRKHEKSNYFRLAHVTARKHVEFPKQQFHSLVSRLVGDKDHEKIQDIEAKVAKSYRQQQTGQRRISSYSYGGRNSSYSYGGQYRRENRPYMRPGLVICYSCGRAGHIRANCPLRDQSTKATENKDVAKQNKN